MILTTSLNNATLAGSGGGGGGDILVNGGIVVESVTASIDIQGQDSVDIGVNTQTEIISITEEQYDILISEDPSDVNIDS